MGILNHNILLHSILGWTQLHSYKVKKGEVYSNGLHCLLCIAHWPWCLFIAEMYCCKVIHSTNITLELHKNTISLYFIKYSLH